MHLFSWQSDSIAGMRLPLIIGTIGGIVMCAAGYAWNSSVPVSFLTTFARHENEDAALPRSIDDVSRRRLTAKRIEAPAIPESAGIGSHALRLTGVVLGNTSLALISIDGLPAQPYEVGDSIANGIVLCQVSAFGAVVRRGAAVANLVLHRTNARVVQLIPAPIVPSAMRRAVHQEGTDWYMLDRHYVADFLKSNDFLTQGKIAAGSDGSIRIVDLNPIGLFADLGLHAGDVVRDINVDGQSVNAISNMPGFIRQIGHAQQVQLEVLTNGHTRYLHYNLN